MNNWIVLPTVLPAMTAALLILALPHHLKHQRVVSVGSTLLTLALAIGLLVLAGDGQPRAYFLGNWPAPFGIVLVLDRLSAIMLLLTAALALMVAVYACAGWDKRGRHFHALLQFQILGVNGAFLTGDLFNLFVFFEVMLIASYGLMLHGGGAPRLKAGFHYVAINLIASTLFLFGVGLIYAITGTLNMADLAGKVAAVSAGDQALLKTGAMLLFAVFATKAALVPLHWWLPSAYAATSAPAAAMFMIMTKVGAYAIIRVYGLIFGAEAGPLGAIAAPIVIPAALVTLIVGAVGVLASRNLRDLVCFSVVASMGNLLIAVGLFDGPGTTAALSYLVHSTLTGAALFLLVDVIAQRRGPQLDRLEPAPAIGNETLLGAMFFLAAIAMVGMPPLSGFIGKLLILDATRGAPHASLIWTTILGASLLMMIGYARAGSMIFWNNTEPVPSSGGAALGRAPDRLTGITLVPILVIAVLLAATAALSLGAGPFTGAFAATSEQLLDKAGYVRAVLAPAAGTGTGGN
ncbi:monovalent cation/H+ antiporter subunit D [Bosea sp. (in: a-proteobacteria)]|uniref:monovalent cation/H+ antiporter subunit D n=1 Tax=Bosea sp. (in: a-proteobacteria) TaxID=1871050 RepID=UPI0027350FE7|nr:monovalent cation/H+ antiporter subunit D [Bosea sp. (in: a-proteobacteria)]MDP3257016.1 monovalent cation/H+ antiporter subunit D [Bosea sp. (in: a-proteobacteria)]